MQTIMKGIPAAPGLTKGNIFLVSNQSVSVPVYSISDIPAEMERLKTAQSASIQELDAFKAKIMAEQAASEAEIFEAHKMILQDESLTMMADESIQSGTNAESAWMQSVNFFASQLESLDDPTLSSRAVDVRDVGQRVLRHLMGLGGGGINLTKPSVVVGRDLTPSDTASLDRNLSLAFLTAEGGPTSHTAILAKAFGLPAVVGLGKELLELPPESVVLVDGSTGIVIVNPDTETLAAFEGKMKEASLAMRDALAAAFTPARTIDGHVVEVVANIGGEDDAKFAHENGAEGVGLFRTEFLYLHRDSEPNEDEQVEVYQRVFSFFKDQPVVVRTLDIGGDKEVPYLNFTKELNPFLGWRGVRMLDGRSDLFVTQIRALLRASIGVNLCIMVPMIARLEEIEAMKALLEAEKAKLRSEGIPYGDNIQFGIMVEVPSAAINSDKLAKSIDFFSIGTNDLTQYTLAVDRTNSSVAKIGSSFDPAVLYLIQRTIESAHAEGKWCGMCGEFAGEPLAMPILLAMGLDEFSMSPARVPGAKQLLRKLSMAECKELLKDVMQCVTAGEVKQLVTDFLVGKEISVE